MLDSAIGTTMYTLHTRRCFSMANLSIRVPEEIGEQLDKLGSARFFL